MRLILKNVGKIYEGNIELNGITVIAGENNTGKSTVGKMLFSIFNSFYKIEEQINNERQRTIARTIANYYHEAANRVTRRFDPHELARMIVENREVFIADTKILTKELEQFYLRTDKNFPKYYDQESLNLLTEKIYEFLRVEDSDIRKAILKKRLEAEFGMKVGHLNMPTEDSRVVLEIKNNSIAFEIANNENISIKSYMSLVKEIIYIDDPFVLDNLNSGFPLRFLDLFEHRNDLLDKLKNNRGKDFGTLDELIVSKKLERIFKTMDGICDGELTSSDDTNNYAYKTDKLNGNLNIENISTGMKTFIILRTLLQNGSIDEDGIIILDEPEIHLHPEWQLKFAEIIVLIQKEFGTNILLNTHSPYFLNAIQVFSERHNVADKCKYYLTEEIENKTNIKDVTNYVESIYEKLARPLQELENLEFRNEQILQ